MIDENEMINEITTLQDNTKTNSIAKHSRNDPPAHLQNPEHENILFIHGTVANFAKHAFNHAVEFNKDIISRFGPFTSIKMKEDHLIITCKNQAQKQQIKQETEIFGCSVRIADPSNPANLDQSQNRNHYGVLSKEKYNKGIIFGVPIDIDDSEIMTETGAITARRLTTFADGEKKTTETVILGYIEDLPSTVYLGFLRFNVKLYIPHPFRCNN